MYSTINSNCKNLFREEKLKSHVDDYKWLIENLKTRNVSSCTEYQKNYRKFWVMRYVSPNSIYSAKYFLYLEENKFCDPSLRDTLMELSKYPTDKNNERTSFQFSFATKLHHMINNSYPIYDGMVGDFFLLPKIDTQKTIESRIEMCEKIVLFLRQEYKRVIDGGMLKISIDSFKEEYPGARFQTTKIIDSLIWSFVSSAKNGGFLPPLAG